MMDDKRCKVNDYQCLFCPSCLNKRLKQVLFWRNCSYSFATLRYLSTFSFTRKISSSYLQYISSMDTLGDAMQFVWSATSQRVMADILRHQNEYQTNKDLLQDAIKRELMETSREKTYAGNKHEFFRLVHIAHCEAHSGLNIKPVE